MYINNILAFISPNCYIFIHIIINRVETTEAIAYLGCYLFLATFYSVVSFDYIYNNNNSIKFTKFYFTKFERSLY